MKMKTEVVDFFVKPAVLLAKMESMSGHVGATNAIIHTPHNRPHFFCLGINMTISTPVMAIRSSVAIAINREFLILGTTKLTRMIPKSMTVFVGINIKTVSGAPKPKSSMMIGPNLRMTLVNF
jgi:hypothetical protein